MFGDFLFDLLDSFYHPKENSFFPEVSTELNIQWSDSAQQDLRSVYNIEAEIELSNMLAQEIRAEIDANILYDLRENSGFAAFANNILQLAGTNFVVVNPEIPRVLSSIGRDDKCEKINWKQEGF